MGKNVIVDGNLDCFGWKTYVQQRKGTTKITINKIIATGCRLLKGQPLYCYVAKDKNGRRILVVYPDGKPRKEM